jgi:hypothetical protein
MSPPVPDHLRGTGRTTEQLKALKKGGLYLAYGDPDLHYHRRLTHSLGLGPIAHMTLSRFLDGGWLQARYSDFDIDHHVEEQTFINYRLQEVLDYLESRMPDAAYFVRLRRLYPRK